jgi:hypothetical protein
LVNFRNITARWIQDGPQRKNSKRNGRLCCPKMATQILSSIPYSLLGLSFYQELKFIDLPLNLGKLSTGS